MTAACPTCNAPITFRFDDSFVRVCEHCNSCVVRTDRGVDTLGAFADLAPIDSPIRLFSDGHDRNTSFLLVGMAQLRHAAGGTWQEWYAKLDGGEWCAAPARRTRPQRPPSRGRDMWAGAGRRPS